MKYGDWVMYYDNLHKVSRQIGGKVYLYPHWFSFGWTDARFIAKWEDQDQKEIIALLNECIPITKEVADIMRGV